MRINWSVGRSTNSSLQSVSYWSICSLISYDWTNQSLVCFSWSVGRDGRRLSWYYDDLSIRFTTTFDTMVNNRFNGSEKWIIKKQNGLSIQRLTVQLMQTVNSSTNTIVLLEKVSMYKWSNRSLVQLVGWPFCLSTVQVKRFDCLVITLWCVLFIINRQIRR